MYSLTNIGHCDLKIEVGYKENAGFWFQLLIEETVEGGYSTTFLTILSSYCICSSFIYFKLQYTNSSNLDYILPN